MGGFYSKSNKNNEACVLIVHCVDTEGPIGGDVRRKPDGSKEFMDNWVDIKNSLKDITNKNFRAENKDSIGAPFKLNWFIMDFMGFKTNPKNRIQEYNDTYDNIKSLNTQQDSFHWHYHQPPISGIGDQWSESWAASNEHYNILGNRIIHRKDFPEAFRSGGTIEDNLCSLWLEDNIMVDYSNRVSHRSTHTDNIFDFNWYAAPDHWGYYHPSVEDFLKLGEMNRYIVRSVDLESRLHILEQWQVDEAFEKSKKENKPMILSYFSHDHRDMRAETYRAIDMIRKSSKKYNIKFKWCDALEAVQICENIKPEHVNIGFEKYDLDKVKIYFDKKIYQKTPFVYTLCAEGKIKYHRLNLEWIANCPYYLQYCILDVEPDYRKIGVGCTSMSGNSSVAVKNIIDIS